MKRILLCLSLILLLSGCAPAEPLETTVPTTLPIETEPVPTETVPPTTQPSGEKLSLPGIPVEDVILWFNEVCLDAEIVHSGDASLLQKWNQPISYQILGDPTPEDRAVLEGFVQWLNTIEGFPGMAETEDWGNLRIHFVDEPEMQNVMGPGFSGMDGAVTFWYDRNEIYDATVCIRTDLSQTLRNSVILEELYNALGPIQDTALRPDSIIWADFSDPQSLTAVDELILKLLYHEKMRPGMDASQCETVIRELYE